ncbi:hypothetical protein GCM10027418_10510 [Mariniluteicoccus endophyticus]
MNRATKKYLASIGGFTEDVDEQTLDFIMRAFRHDFQDAARYFTQHWTITGLPPLTYLTGADDPTHP